MNRKIFKYLHTILFCFILLSFLPLSTFAEQNVNPVELFKTASMERIIKVKPNIIKIKIESIEDLKNIPTVESITTEEKIENVEQEEIRQEEIKQEFEDDIKNALFSEETDADSVVKVETVVKPTPIPTPSVTPTPTPEPHIHNWSASSCTEPQKCECGETQGEANGHHWLAATTEKAKTCNVCGLTEGEPLPKPSPTPIPTPEPIQTPIPTPTPEPSILPEIEATPTPSESPSEIPEDKKENDEGILPEVSPETSLPPVVEEPVETPIPTPEPHIHNWSASSCTEPQKCECGEIQGEANGHHWLAATTEKAKTCNVCGLTEGEPLPKPSPTPEATPTPTIIPEPTPEVPKEEVETVVLYPVTYNGTIVYDTMENLLAAIVMNETRGVFHPEMLKAQAIAAHSWLLYSYSHNTPYPSVGLKTPNQACKDAVTAVKDIIVTYNGKAALTPYYSSNAGTTHSSVEVWGGSLPYLVSVESKYDYLADSYERTKVIHKDTMKSKLESYFSGVELKDGKESSWIVILNRINGNYCNEVKVGNLTLRNGKIIKGTHIYNALGLRSTSFDIEYNSEDQSFYITTYGWGHSVGMSQYGAHFYAEKEGWNYEKILKHYFPNTQLTVVKE